MRFVLFVVCALLAATLAGAVRATDAEPVVYIFWSARCPVSEGARAYLLKAQSADPTIQVRDFEVDHEPKNMRLLGRVYEGLGLPGFTFVPLIIVGPDVAVGYVDDDTTGQEILDRIAACRRERCPDIMREVIEPLPTAGRPTAPRPWNVRLPAPRPATLSTQR